MGCTNNVSMNQQRQEENFACPYSQNDPKASVIEDKKIFEKRERVRKRAGESPPGLVTGILSGPKWWSSSLGARDEDRGRWTGRARGRHCGFARCMASCLSGEKIWLFEQKRARDLAVHVCCCSLLLRLFILLRLTPGTIWTWKAPPTKANRE